MALNLKKNERSLLEAWKWLKDANKVGKWVLFDYEGKTFNLQHVGSGDGGLEELTEDFSDGRIMYGAVCVEDPNSGLPKIVFIVWQGLSVPEITRGKCAVHADPVLKFFKGYHVNITARGESDIDEKTVLEKVKQCSGANYSVHKEKPIPAQKQSHPVAVYEKIDPSKEISSSEREKFWKKDAEESTSQPTEKASVIRAQEVKASRSAIDTFKQIDQDRVQREKELEQEKRKQQAAIRETVKQASIERLSDSSSDRKETNDFKNLPAGKASAFKAIFEQKIDEQTESASSRPPPSTSKTTKKWEPVQTTSQTTFKSEPPPQFTQQSSSSVTTRRESELDFPPPSPSYDSSHHSPVPAPSSGSFNVIALYDYSASDETEISFRTGEKITDVIKEDEEWWVGTNSSGKRGQLPYNFVAMEGTEEATEALQILASELENLNAADVISTARVVYDYNATDSDELTILENEVVSILEKRSDGWWVAQNKQGNTGLIPCNFVEEN